MYQDNIIHFNSKWKNFRFIDLFAGIGGIRLGFENLGGKCVFSSEWDEQACKTYTATLMIYLMEIFQK